MAKLMTANMKMSKKEKGATGAKSAPNKPKPAGASAKSAPRKAK